MKVFAHKLAFFFFILTAAFSAAGAWAQDRVLGLDVASWQGNISQTTWNNFLNVHDREFVFIRSSRGGTTGFYNQSNPGNNNPPGQNTLSQRYDDHYFVQNITRATNAGLLAGPYHYSRPDIVETTLNSNGIANTGTDEADHFIQMAGAFMRPGYLLPVFDLEDGDSERTANEIAQFSIDFSDRIHETFGIRPIMYINGNYSTILQSSSLDSELVEAFPHLWNARYAYQDNPNSTAVQTAHPKDTFGGFYGPWDDAPNPSQPWDFWQYASSLRLSSYNNGNSNLDANVAQGGIEFVKDRLVPALWTGAGDGDWSTLANWNSGQAPIVPVQGPGQTPRVGPLTLPTERLPSTNDTVILEADGDITVTLSSGSHEVRKLYVNEALDITGGSLTVNYVPSADSTPESARFSAPVTLSGPASLSVHTLEVASGQDFTAGNAFLFFEQIELAADPLTPASLSINGAMLFSPLDDDSARISNGSGVGQSGFVDLEGGQQLIAVNDGAALIDLIIETPIVNGGLTKQGTGVLSITGPGGYTGDTVVDTGLLTISNPILSDTADLVLSETSALNLNFAAVDTIDRLVIGGVVQEAGVWGGAGSGADFISPLLSGSGTLMVLSGPLAGDYNGDGVVDTDDFVVWRDNYGSTSSLAADGNGDGVVDAADFTIWRDNQTPAAQSVPEPAAGLLAVLGLLLGGRARRLAVR